MNTTNQPRFAEWIATEGYEPVMTKHSDMRYWCWSRGEVLKTTTELYKEYQMYTSGTGCVEDVINGAHQRPTRL